ncbi:MAG: tRNA (N(6)-L-threonylcarbamoyladenosine(37)-C(2))-methylthiotransferase MtaB [Gemmatimonadales bacterium]|nr:MAG: tRNA (N(6)-L-threonylcarbamoyladenosine(37)-C(2))-methylthiotransferase MtaB [Gemmatimonadales bacterium]
MRVYLHTFGCKSNQYDTEQVHKALEAAGAVVVDRAELADWAVVNSCTVTHVAEAKMRGFVRRLKRLSPGIKTIVMGCAAALDDGTIAGLPGVERVIAGGNPAEVMSAIGLRPPGGEAFGGSRRGARAWLKIQDGCDEHCTFCATTLARGDSRSRKVEELVREAELLAEHHAEIVLTGIHIGSYGRDLDPPTTLGRLVERLVERVPSVRFRLSSVEATEVDDLLAALMVECPERLAPHLHAPLQSGSDRLLKRMGRHWYTAATYRQRIEWLAARLPRFGLGADVMVGFPGEEEKDHSATLALVRSLPFTYLHVFPYSPRRGTAALRLGAPVHPEVVARRSAELRELAAERRREYEASREHQSADVVILERNRGVYRGLTEDYLTVYLGTHRALPPRFPAVLRRQGDRMIAEVPEVSEPEGAPASRVGV